MSTAANVRARAELRLPGFELRATYQDDNGARGLRVAGLSREHAAALFELLQTSPRVTRLACIDPHAETGTPSLWERR
jgi:hypothetical protein